MLPPLKLPPDHRADCQPTTEDTLDAKGGNRRAILKKLPSAKAGDQIAGIHRSILHGRLPRCKPLLLFKASSSHALDFMPKEKCYSLTAGDCKLFMP